MADADPRAPPGREEGSRKPSWRALSALVVLFALPFVGAWLFYLNPDWLPEPSVSGGELIEPPRRVGDHGYEWGAREGSWVLLTVGVDGCGGACRARVERLGRYRAALGAERHRVATLLALVRTVDADVAGLESLVDEVLLVDAASVTGLFGAGDTGYIYVVDPRGYLMLRHDMAATSHREFLRTLEQLLQLSASW